MKSQEAALLCKENTKRTLETQAVEATMRAQESKRNNDFIMSMLDRFNKTDNTDECLEKKQKMESKREELGNETCDKKLLKLEEDYLAKDEI